MAKKKMSLDEQLKSIRKQINSFEKESKDNKSDIYTFFYITLGANFVISALGFFTLQGVWAKTPSFIALVVAVVSSIWRFHKPWEKYIAYREGFLSLDKLFFEYQNKIGDFSNKTPKEANDHLRTQYIGIISDTHIKLDKVLSDAINQFLSENETK